MRDLCSAIKPEHVAAGVVHPDGAARLQRDGGVPPQLEIEFDHGMGGSEGALDVAVAVSQHGRFGRTARLEFAGRVRRGEKNRQRLDLDRDQIGCILGHVGVLREHRGDRLPDIAYAPASQDGLSIGQQRLRRGIAKIDRRNVGRILAGPYR